LGQYDTEACFDQIKNMIIPELEGKTYDLVIGIPFSSEAGNIENLLIEIDKVIQSWMGVRHLIVCAGDAAAGAKLAEIKELKLKLPHMEYLLAPEISGRGMAIRTFISISQYLEADLIVLNNSMVADQGFWLDTLLSPIRGAYDMVLGSLSTDLAVENITRLLANPILETFYGCRIRNSLGGIYAISHDFIEELNHEAKFWGKSISGAGIDFWLITRALCWNKNICEAILEGGRSTAVNDQNRLLRETAHAVFEALKRDSAIWLQERLILKVVDKMARNTNQFTGPSEPSFNNLVENFRNNYSALNDVFAALPTDLKNKLDNLYQENTSDFHMEDEIWVGSIYHLLIAYVFNGKIEQDAVIDALNALYQARVASYLMDKQNFSEKLQCVDDKVNELYQKFTEIQEEQLSKKFLNAKTDFIHNWLEKTEANKPPLVPLGYMEYVPGKPVVVPKRMVGKDGFIVQTDNVYRALRKRYDDAFNKFVTEGLGLATGNECEQVQAVERFMQQAEAVLEKVLPGDLYTESGLNQFVNGLFAAVPHEKIFTIHADLLREMLVRFPPVNLMISLGYYKPAKLLQNMDVRDAVTYANLLQSWSYTDRDLLWVLEQLKPESFQWVDLKPNIIDEKAMGYWPHSKVANLNKITACITVKVLEKDEGGKYPRLRYFTSILRRICVAEDYSYLFNLIVKQRKNISVRIKHALFDLQKGDESSAHNIFENFHHRLMVDKIRRMAQQLQEQGDAESARVFNLLADGYGLCQVLANGTFLTCSAWSWASYSFKGGLNIPTPLTTSVESRWFNHDFLQSLYSELGYDEKEIKQTVIRLIISGHSSNNLLDSLLPTRPKDVAVVVQETTNEPSRHLQRYHGNPILEPIENHAWESKYVLNPGALRIKDKVYLFYRAVGEDDVSHIGLAITDGYKLLERLPEPVFSPLLPEEKMGCEDPRLTIINDRIFMLYTAYDGNIAQIAAASISVADFLQRRFNNWKREGLAFKNIWDKDAILFPEKIKGKYVIYHRIEPSIWITYMNEIAFPCREKHAIIIGPRPGRMWDSQKIGAGAQPLKTKYGWLLIYHGVDYNYVYRLGVILVALDNPQRVIYRSPNPVLEPEEDYEIGLSGAWVPNVVFTCGAVAGSEKEILEDDDLILVYYGAADTSIGVATATLADLIPEQFRSQSLEPGFAVDNLR
jgi:predicted GH43/DUF377 family glycosyl hydrolase